MKNKYLEVSQFSVRLSDEEREYINENFNELIKSGNLELSYSKFFMQCITTALSTVKPKVAELSKPEDTKRINELQDKVNELLKNNQDLSKFNDEILEQQEGFIGDIKDLNLRISSMKELSPDEIILKLEPKEKFLLESLANIVKKTPKQLLIDEFLMVYQYRGPGDFNIPKLSNSKLKEIDEYFKTKSV